MRIIARRKPWNQTAVVPIKVTMRNRRIFSERELVELGKSDTAERSAERFMVDHA
jgi:hypothetical protein